MSQLQVEPLNQDKTAAEIQVAEDQRVATIQKICDGEYGKHPDIQAKAIAEHWDLNKTEVACLRASRPKWPGVRPDTGAGNPNVLSAAWLILAGNRSLAEKAYGANVAQQASDLGIITSLDLCAASLQAIGRDPPRGKMNLIRAFFGVQAGFSTVDMPVGLGGALDKSVQAGYDETPATWTGFCAIKSPTNFRPQTSIRPSFVGDVEKVGPAGEIKHGSLGEATFPYKIDTFGKMLGITRQDIINDDLAMLNDSGPALGRACRRGVSDLVWSTIMANTGSFFSGAHTNLMQGGTTCLDLTSLGLAVAAMRAQKNDQGNNVDIVPAVLAVPPELEIMARGILDSEYLQYLSTTVGPVPTGNSLRNVVSLAVEPRLSNSTKFADYSKTAWFLFASPAAAPVIVAFLNGVQGPTVEFFGLQSQADVLGVQYRVYLDYGCAYGDYRAAIRSDGI